ncbi:ankyrin repeat domain-containing protein [Carboxylicivirga sediminis]|uniref:Ankyrin repeat domain-containing protein n=1 Tax=Carboxylicivirga sediminis TaxID=2006564 RepID=A0A941F733_9BACT|nr:ankyrin repeat domain-containing protein [Carboxylicivirga sediminis]MBR8537802.1 ankyrin repeat domain-containing protein [Carboxylicivirga sediminis]
MKTNKNLNLLMVSRMMVLSFILMSACTSKGQSNKVSEQAEKPAKVMDIHAAAFMGDVKAINYHIKAGTDLNQKDEYGSTPLIIATTFNRVEAAKALIDGKADLNLKSKDGSTPLHVAAFFCRTEIVEYLLDNGVDKNLTDSYGSTPLQSVAGAFAEVKPIYEQINRDLGPLGLRLDYEELEATRPKIAELLK